MDEPSVAGRSKLGAVAPIGRAVMRGTLLCVQIRPILTCHRSPVQNARDVFKGCPCSPRILVDERGGIDTTRERILTGRDEVIDDRILDVGVKRTANRYRTNWPRVDLNRVELL